MVPQNYVARKIKLLVERDGTEYTFLRNRLDDRNEPTEEAPEVVKVLKGVFHRSTVHFVGLITDVAGSVQRKHSNGIMAVFADAEEVVQEDSVMVNGVKYKVAGVTNVGEMSLVADIALEEVK